MKYTDELLNKMYKAIKKDRTALEWRDAGSNDEWKSCSLQARTFNVFKDMIINANGLINLSRDNYSREQLEAINKLKVKYRELEE